MEDTSTRQCYRERIYVAVMYVYYGTSGDSYPQILGWTSNQILSKKLVSHHLRLTSTSCYLGA